MALFGLLWARAQWITADWARDSRHSGVTLVMATVSWWLGVSQHNRNQQNLTILGFEPGLSRPHRDGLATRRYGHMLDSQSDCAATASCRHLHRRQPHGHRGHVPLAAGTADKQ